MFDAAVRFVAAALADPAAGLAAQLAALPNLPAGVTLPASVRIVDETATPWVARRACDARELDAGPLVAVHADEALEPDEDAPDGVPWELGAVSCTYLTRGDDAALAAAALAAARHVERAIAAAILAAFPAPIATYGGVALRRPSRGDVRRLEGWEPWGDAAIGATTAVTLRALDAWAHRLT